MGSTPSSLGQGWLGVPPVQVGVPPLFKAGWDTPHWWMEVPPLSKAGWGYPLSKAGWRYPPVQGWTGVSPRPVMGYPPSKAGWGSVYLLRWRRRTFLYFNRKKRNYVHPVGNNWWTTMALFIVFNNMSLWMIFLLVILNQLYSTFSLGLSDDRFFKRHPKHRHTDKLIWRT